MNKKRIIPFCTIAVAIVIMTSCAVTSHPNEKLIVGTWRPVKVEKVVDSTALPAAASKPTEATQIKAKSAKPSGGGNNERVKTSLERLMQVEMRTNLQIFENKTAIKNYAGKPMKATWKMKGHGTRIIAKATENKTRFVIEILEINKERLVVIEHAPAGDLQVTYEREQ